MNQQRGRAPCILSAALVAILALAALAPAQPAILKNVGIDQHLGQTLPLDVVLRDEQGHDLRLADCFHKGRPVLLTFVYYKCPGLCTTTLNQLTRSLNALSESAGDKFDVLTISFDSRETPDLAAAKKETYLRAYRRPTAEAGWRFLTGPADSVGKLVKAAGFRYAWDDVHQVFAHASGVLVLTPDGKISRYFLGVSYPPKELRQALNAAAGETVGPKAEAVFLYCFHYDPATGRYGLIINRAIRAAGVLTLLAIGSVIGFFVVRERRGKGRDDAPAVATTGGG
jgi:protein SCO1/2